MKKELQIITSFTQKRDLQHLVFVSVSKGKAITIGHGLETELDESLSNGTLKVTPKGVVYVFNFWDEKWVGCVVHDKYDLFIKAMADKNKIFEDFFGMKAKDLLVKV